MKYLIDPAAKSLVYYLMAMAADLDYHFYSILLIIYMNGAV